MAELAVNQNTSLADLQRFLHDANPASKIRVGRGADGGTTLYVSGKASGVFGRLTGATERRQEGARATILDIVTRVGGSPNLVVSIRAEMSRPTGEVDARRVMGKIGEGSAFGDAVWARQNGSPGLAALAPFATRFRHGDDEFQAALRDLAASGRPGSDVDRAGATEKVARLLAIGLAHDVDPTNPRSLAELAFKPVPMVAHDLRAHLESKGVAPDAAEQLVRGVSSALKEARIGQAANAMDVKIVAFDPDGGTLKGDDGSVLSGVVAKPLHTIGGAVLRFDSDGLGGGKMALKYADPAAAAELAGKNPGKRAGQLAMVDAATEMFREMRANLAVKANTPGDHLVHPRFVGMTAEGRGVIGMPWLEHGSAETAVSLLGEARKQGGDPRRLEAAALLLTKDMLRGIADLHDAGLKHLDLKPGNMFVTGDAVGQVADFGSLRSIGGPANDLPGVENPRWKAPEFIVAEMKATFEGQNTERQAQGRDALVRRLMGSGPNALANVRGLGAPYHPPVEGAADVFSAGVSLHEFLLGTLPVDASMGREVEDAVLGRAGIVPVPDETAASATLLGLQPSLGATARLPGTEARTPANDLLNDLMTGDPANRPDAKAALRHPALRGLNEAAARADLKAVLETGRLP